MRKNLVIITLLISITTLSQSTIYIGTKSYSATQSWTFTNAGIVNSYSWNGATLVSVGKKQSGGLLMLSTQTISSQSSIAGNVIVYLNNRNAFSISNRLYKDYADGNSIAIYSLTDAQVSLLKKYNISSIRFTIWNSSHKSSTTAENRNNISTDPSVYKVYIHNTAQQVEDLFSN